MKETNSNVDSVSVDMPNHIQYSLWQKVWGKSIGYTHLGLSYVTAHNIRSLRDTSGRATFLWMLCGDVVHVARPHTRLPKSYLQLIHCYSAEAHVVTSYIPIALSKPME